MFVVINPFKNKTYGRFVTFEEARIWGEDPYNAPHVSGSWYVNEVEFVQSDSSMKGVSRNDEDDGC